jgi:uncharacterized protein YndB with AHSA1/START domain
MTATDDRLGQVLRGGDRAGLRYVRRLAHPPTKVWRALTESDHLRHWFPADIVGERHPGAALSFPFWPELVEAHSIEDPAPTGELRVWDPPRELALTWGGDVLHWELEPEGDGTRLVFTTWLEEGSPAGVAGAGAGYHVCLDALEQLLDTGSAPGLADANPAALEERYRNLFESAPSGGE